jgi:hypothetical protein
MNHRLEDDLDHGGRILGYLTLIEHLKGNFAQAETDYHTAIGNLTLAGNVREQSIFLCHLADVQMHDPRTTNIAPSGGRRKRLRCLDRLQSR